MEWKSSESYRFFWLDYKPLTNQHKRHLKQRERSLTILQSYKSELFFRVPCVCVSVTVCIGASGTLEMTLLESQ